MDFGSVEFMNNPLVMDIINCISSEADFSI